MAVRIDISGRRAGRGAMTMTITHAKYNADGSVTAGPIEGLTWSGLTEGSRFWPLIQEWVAAGNTIKPYEQIVKEIVPEKISDRQFFQQMALEGVITREEAEEAVSTGAIPESMALVINSLPEDQQWSVRMLVRGATEFFRNHPVTEFIGQLYGFTPEQINQIWIKASKL